MPLNIVVPLFGSDPFGALLFLSHFGAFYQELLVVILSHCLMPNYDTLTCVNPISMKPNDTPTLM